MRLLRRVSMIAVLAAGLAPAAAAQDTLTMSLSDVKPGMKGVGFSVFNGFDPEPFEFTVRGISPFMQINDNEIWPAVITIELSGGPPLPDGRALFEKNLIYGGMSGSPMFIEGKVIGSLSLGAGFLTASQALVTPIEMQFSMGNLAHAGHTGSSIVNPGDYLAFCFVAGDLPGCASATATARRDGHLYAVGHSIGIPYGTIEIPVYRAKVADLMQSQERAYKMGGGYGEEVGCAVIHGMFGIVIHEGERCRTFPVHLSLTEAVPGGSAEFDMPLAYHIAATGRLKNSINAAVHRLPMDPQDVGLDVALTLRAPVSGTYRFSDTYVAATASLESLLDALIMQEREALDIGRIDIRYRRLSSRDLWTPLQIDIDRKHSGTVTARLKRGRDNIVEDVRARTAVPSKKDIRGLETKWLSGTGVQSELLNRMPAREVLAFFPVIENRDALYFVASPRTATMTVSATSVLGVQKINSEFRILLTETFGGRRFSVAFGEKVAQRVH